MEHPNGNQQSPRDPSASATGAPAVMASEPSNVNNTVAPLTLANLQRLPSDLSSSPLTSLGSTPTTPSFSLQALARDVVFESGLPVVHLLRHAQSAHKPTEGNNGNKRGELLTRIKDPSLTERGIEQSINVFKDRPDLWENISHIWTCPSSRCLQTTIHATESLLKSGRVVASVMSAMVGFGGGNNNTYKSLAELKEMFGSRDDDISGTHEYAELIEVDEYVAERSHEGNPSTNKGIVHMLLEGWAEEGERPEVLMTTHSSFMRVWLSQPRAYFGPATLLSLRWDTENNKWVNITVEELEIYRDNRWRRERAIWTELGVGEPVDKTDDDSDFAKAS